VTGRGDELNPEPPEVPRDGAEHVRVGFAAVAAAGADLAEPERAAEEPKGLAVGEALRRTVTIEAEGAFGMMLPPLPVPAIAGLSAYPDPPHVEDRGGERGAARVARRVESVAYRLGREGDYELPAIEVAWWDVGAKQMRRARLAAVAFSVAPAPARADEIPLPDEMIRSSFL